MNDLYLHELSSRGTPDFPLELYLVDEKHPRYNMQLHWHKEFELIYVFSGVLNMRLNDRFLSLREHESVFIPSEILHSAVPVNCKYQCMVFSPDILFSAQKARFLIDSQILAPYVFKKDPTTKTILSLIKSKEFGYELSVIGNLYILCNKMVTSKSEIKISPDNKIEKIKAVLHYIEKNYSEKVTLSDLATVSSMHPNYFCRFFKEITGESPIAYLTLYRIEKSCELLISGIPVTETAYLCGFNDTSYFINIFKKYLKVSPKKYQLLHLKNKG